MSQAVIRRQGYDATNGNEARPAFMPDSALSDWIKARSFVNVIDYGAAPDSTLVPGEGTDNADAFDAAIAAAGEGGTVFIPKGNYRITRTIRVFRRSVRGEFPGHVDLNASLIFCDFQSGAGFNVSGSRGTIVENLAFLGVNDAPITADANFSAIKSDWLSPGVDNSQTSPYSGLAIDSTDEGTSFFVTVRNCSICRFAVGFAVSPFGGILGAAIDVYSCYIAFNVFNVSIGNSQNRGVRFFGGSFNHAWTSFTNLAHGTQSPLRPSLIQIFGTDSNFCYRLFDLDSSSGGAFLCSGMYSEACFSIGNFSKDNASAIRHSFSFIGCDFFLSKDWSSSCFLRINSGSFTSFRNCSFYGREKIFAMRAKKEKLTFRDCYFSGLVAYRIGINELGRQNVDLDNCNLDNCSNLTEIRREVFTLLNGSSNKRIDIHDRCERVKDSYYSTANRALKVEDKDFPKTDIYSISGHNWTGNTLTFTCSGAERLRLGDFLSWPLASTGEQYEASDAIPSVEVTEISGSNITCQAIANNVDKTAIPTTIFLEIDSFVTKFDITGDIASGSAVVTNCADAGLLKAGDFVNASNGFPGSGTRVVSVNAGSSQFTLNRTSSATDTGVVFENKRGVREWE